jgi:hypothetical protein
MANGITTFLANELLDACLNNGAYHCTTPYAALHTADPGKTGASEVAGGSYARQSLAAAMAPAASAAATNDVVVTFLNLPACTVGWVSIWDAVSGGNCLWTGVLGASRTFVANDFGSFATGEFDMTLG